MKITQEQENILKEAIEKYGFLPQLDMVIEECSELIKAISKYKREQNRETVSEMLKESADVFIMLEQIWLMFPNRFVKPQEEIDYKINRLKQRLKNN